MNVTPDLQEQILQRCPPELHNGRYGTRMPIYPNNVCRSISVSRLTNGSLPCHSQQVTTLSNPEAFFALSLVDHYQRTCLQRN